MPLLQQVLNSLKWLSDNGYDLPCQNVWTPQKRSMAGLKEKYCCIQEGRCLHEQKVIDMTVLIT